MPSDPLSPADTPATWDHRFADFLYRRRWPLTVVALLVTGLVFAQGTGRIGSFASSLTALGDTSNGSGKTPPLVFDPSLDIWFGASDPAVETYYEIEDRFVAEDFVVVSFEVPDHELGVFSRQSLETISRLTDRFLTVPGVRHVRSLTYNPWIRWGDIDDGFGASEKGLIITDLVEEDPATLSDAEIVERMVAILGAERTAARIGESRVRAVIGQQADFADFIGEPLLLGTILDESGSTTAIQVQVLRPRVDDNTLAGAFGEDPETRRAAATLFSSQFQRSALRGIEHFLQLEMGRAVPTPELEQRRAELETLAQGETRDASLLELADPTRNFLLLPDGERIRKFFDYRPEGNGWVDRSDPAEPVSAPASFEPRPASPYTFHIGGVPSFERNFEDVGMADARFVPLMFVVIAACLLLVFRHFMGVFAPLTVVIGSILAMVGVSFAMGDLFNNLTMMAPNMVTAVGIADAVHLVASWAYLRGRIRGRRQLITEVMRRNALPVLLTSITTSIGFYSLTVSELAPVTMLGYTAGLGALIAYVLSMTLIPSLLSLVPERSESARALRLARVFSPERTARWITWVLRRRRPILGTSGLLVAIAFFGLARVEIDTDFRGMFPDENLTMRDFRWIEGRLGGVGDIEIVFAGLPPAPAQTSPAPDFERLETLSLRQVAIEEGQPGFTPLSRAEREELGRLEADRARYEASRIGVSTEFLAELDAFELRLRQEMADSASPLALITDLISPLDILRKMHQVQNENQAAMYRVPGEQDVAADSRRASLRFDEWTETWSLTPAQDGSSLVAQYYLQYENGARPGENLETQLSADRRQLRMQGRILQGSSTQHRAAFQRIEDIATEEFPALSVRATLGQNQETATTAGGGATDENAQASMTLSGKTLLFARTTHLFAVGFVKSMAIALITITLLIGLIFRSARLALISLLPNVLPILIPLSLFGLAGWQLHGPAILVSSVALGVCVDDTIHFLTKFVRARRRGDDLETSLSYVLQETGPALTITTVVLMLGFSTLLLSDFTPNFMMGALATLMIGLAWVADFIVTPAVLSLFHRPVSVSFEPAPLDGQRQPASA